ncbi:MAG: hypothetical protein FWG40_00680 [Peptococcaceae bacterium]|nr:hypothetical protein [Peptococcaceae bacterium]
MAPETNITVTDEFARVHSIDFVEQFNGSLKKLLEALGVTRKQPMALGSIIKTYKTIKDVKNGVVEEGDLIPLSKITTEEGDPYELPFNKWRKAVTVEAIQKHGFTQAVINTDTELLKEIQKGIRKKFFDFLATGTGTASGVGLQGALAQGWGATQALFEDDGVETIAFVNPFDIADYIGQATLVHQNIFGMNYLEGFTGVRGVLTNTNVPQGYLYATVPSNIVLAWIVVNGAGEISKAIPLTTDETGYIGVTHEPQNKTMSYETVAASGVLLFAERLDGVVKVEIESGLAPVGP